MNHHLRTAALLLALATALPAGAGEPRRGVLELDPDASPDDTRALVERLLGEPFDAERADLDALLDTGYGEWAPLPPARLVPCEGDPMTAAELHAVVEEAENLLEQLEYGEAGARLARAERALCACSAPYGSVDAVRIAFLQGITDHYSGDPDSARRSFARAAERDPGLAWDADYPPEARALFDEALAAAQRAPRAAASAADGLPRILVDGQLLGTAPVELFGERHVLQVAGDDGALRGAWLQTGGADTVHLLDAAALRAGLQEPRAGAFPLLEELAAHAGYDELVLARRGARDSLLHYRANTGVWLEVHVSVADPWQPARRHRAAGLVVLGTGAALVIAGAAVAEHHADAAAGLEPAMVGSAGMYDLLLSEFEQHQRGANAGTALAAAGGAAVIAGVVLLVRGGVLQQQAGLQAGLSATPDGAGFTLRGRF